MLEAVTNIEDVLAERPRDQTGKGRIDIRDVSVTFGKGRSSHRAGRIDAPADRAGRVRLFVRSLGVRKINTA